MTDLSIILQILWTGLATSSYIVLFSIAFALVLKVVKVWNFAQAGLMGISFYAMYAAIEWLRWPAAAAILLGLVLTIVAGIAMEVFGLHTLRQRKSPNLTFFIFTLVCSEFVAYLLTMIFGTEPVALTRNIMSPVRLVGEIAVSDWDLMAVGTTMALLAGLCVYLKFSRQGQFMGAVADNAELARFYGISVRSAYVATFVMAGVLVTAGMYLFGVRVSMIPNTPLQMMLFAVIATLLGGIGNVFAAGAAALVLGLLQSLSILVIPSQWQGALLYVFLFVTILFFPSGVRLWRGPRIAAAPIAQASH